MVDRAYKGAIPAFRESLDELEREFGKVESRTDWVRLRIEPLRRHVESLEAILRSRRFSGEIERLRRGVPMFHSDLVYLRENVIELRAALRREQRAALRSR